jgi:DNA replication and repair protein RecF
MTLSELRLANFRNFAKADIELSAGVNLLLGDNGQGKTNLVEAVHLLSTTRSFRTSRDGDLIRFGEGIAYVGGGDVEVAIQPGEKVIRVGGKHARAAEVVGVIRSVLFTPQDMNLLSGPPQGRRAFLDELISRVDRKYLLTLLSYNKVLKQRNRQLWLVREGRGRLDSLLSWNELMLRDGTALLFRRREIVRKLQDYLNELADQLIGRRADLRYISRIADEGATSEAIRRVFLEKMSLTADEEIRTASSLTGPHRDDFEVVITGVETDKHGRSLGRFGSRGEQRSAILALKLAEVGFNEEETGSRPILLLDDVLSELDEKHQRRILREVGKQQTLITATSKAGFPEEVLGGSRVFLIDSGAIKEEK